jgi:hypothetical protein
MLSVAVQPHRDRTDGAGLGFAAPEAAVADAVTGT